MQKKHYNGKNEYLSRMILFLIALFKWFISLNSQNNCVNWLDIMTPAAKSLQSCPTLFDPIDSSPPGSPIPGVLQARTLEWVAISFSNTWKWKVKMKSLSRVRLLATPWTAAHQAPPSMGFSRQEYLNGMPLPSPLTVAVMSNSAADTVTGFASFGSHWQALSLYLWMCC